MTKLSVRTRKSTMETAPRVKPVTNKNISLNYRHGK